MKAKLTTFLGGPYSYQQSNLNGCMKSLKISAKCQIGYYERSFPESDSMRWKESQKRWYLIDSKVELTKNKLDKLGCMGVIEQSIHWDRDSEGKQCLVRRVGIDIESPFTAFELVYADSIRHIAKDTYTTLEEFRYKK